MKSLVVFVKLTLKKILKILKHALSREAIRSKRYKRPFQKLSIKTEKKQKQETRRHKKLVPFVTQFQLLLFIKIWKA